MVKTEAQILEIEKVQKAVEAAASAVIGYLRGSKEPCAERKALGIGSLRADQGVLAAPSKNPASEEAHKIIDKILDKFGCESPEGHIVAGGKQSAEPHEKGTGILNKGEPIVIDIYPRSKTTGFFADMSRTVCLGEPSPLLQKMYDTVLGAEDLAISMIKPGVRCVDIHEAVEKFFVRNGYLTSGKGKDFPFAEGFVHGLGHGVGLNVHEAPRLGQKSEDILIEGDVITIEPGLYYKNIGGVRIEDMLLVTRDGYRNLTNFSKAFVL